MNNPETSVIFHAPEDDRNAERNKIELDLFENVEAIEKASEEETEILAEKLAELGKLRGRAVLHLWQSSYSGPMLSREIPDQIKRGHNSYQDLYIARDESVQSVEHRVVINEDTKDQDKEHSRLQRELEKSAIVIVGGGPGHPGDAQDKLLLKSLGEYIKNGGIVLGICKGQQYLAELYTSGSVQARGMEAGPNIHYATEGGKKNAFTPPRFVAFNWNEYMVAGTMSDNDITDLYTILARSATTGHGTALLWHDGHLSTQFHPEVGMAGERVDLNQIERTYQIGNPDIAQVEISAPTGMHPDYYRTLEVCASPFFYEFQKKYGLNQDDIKDIFDPRKYQQPNLGKDFYVPALNYLADRLLNKDQNLPKKS